MPRSFPDVATISAAIALAGRAPSLHNSQPWRWSVRETTVHLSAARGRWLPATDPTGSGMLLSCGVVLHHARVAFAGLGWASEAVLLPSSQHPDRLASLRFRPHTPNADDRALTDAISARRSDRRPYSSRPVADADLRSALDAARGDGVQLRRIAAGAERRALLDLLGRATSERAADAVWHVEQRLWVGNDRTAGVGIPTTNAPLLAESLASPVTGADPRSADPRYAEDLGEVLLLATDTDTAAARLNAGVAASAVMLAATVQGLSTCALSQVLEVETTRRDLGRRFLASSGFPQLLLRIGWPPQDSDPVPATPRLRLDEILDLAPQRA